MTKIGRHQFAMLGASLALILLSVIGLNYRGPLGHSFSHARSKIASAVSPARTADSSTEPGPVERALSAIKRAFSKAKSRDTWLTDQVIRGQLPPPAGPENQGAVPFVSDNVAFMGNVPMGGAAIVGSPGGRFKKVGDRTYFFLTGTTNGLTVLDATDAAHPIIVGEMALPHWENEDVDLSGNILLISADGSYGSSLFVIDISIPNVPHLRGALRLSSALSGGPGHIANCIQDCRYAWITGARGGTVAIVSLGEPSAAVTQPSLVGSFHPPAGDPNGVFKNGVVHDVNVDPAGLVWMTGSGGISVYSIDSAAGASPTNPKHIASNAATDRNTFILHNSLRPNAGNLVYVTEENWENDNGECENEGRFETFYFDGSNIAPISTWLHEPRTANYSQGTAPIGFLCSAHWFDYRGDGTIAIGYYQQGIRFLDVRNPAAIAEKGWWLAPDTVASAAYFHPQSSDIVYAVDYQRGLDVLRLCDGKCSAPVAATTYTPVHTRVQFAASPVWGYACPLTYRREATPSHDE